MNDEHTDSGPVSATGGLAETWDDPLRAHDAAAYWVGPPPPLVVRNRGYDAVRLIGRPLLRWLFQTEVLGADFVPADGPVILAATHRSNADIPFLGAVTPRPVNFMAKHQLFVHPRLRRIFTNLGSFPVNREATDKRAVERALQVLDAGGVLGIFPEGTFGQGDRIGDCPRGVAWLAAHAGVPVIPVGIGGSARVQPAGTAALHLAKVRIVVGSAIPPPSGRGKSAVLGLATTITHELQLAFDAAGREAGPGAKVPAAEYVPGF